MLTVFITRATPASAVQDVACTVYLSVCHKSAQLIELVLGIEAIVSLLHWPPLAESIM